LKLQGLVVTSALVIWKTLMLATGSESPVVVVLSGSMEPGLQRGDILFLNMGAKPIRAGEIVVFNLDGRDVPIVHRVLKVHERRRKEKEGGGEKGERVSVASVPAGLPPIPPPLPHSDLLTKGDNNYGDDRLLYNPGQEWLHRRHVMGRAVGYLPHVGMVTIWMNDHPWLKYGLIGVLGLLVVTSKE
jgi:signal peptidase